MTQHRYHRIAEEPKLNHDLPEPELHSYSELDVVNEALRELLSHLYSERNGYLCRDKAHVAVKLMYRIEEHHKTARDGRPDYPPFSWEMVHHFARTAPFTYPEYSTTRQGGEPGPRQRSDSPRLRTAPATPQEETTE